MVLSCSTNIFRPNRSSSQSRVMNWTSVYPCCARISIISRDWNYLRVPNEVCQIENMAQSKDSWVARHRRLKSAPPSSREDNICPSRTTLHNCIVLHMCAPWQKHGMHGNSLGAEESSRILVAPITLPFDVCLWRLSFAFVSRVYPWWEKIHVFYYRDNSDQFRVEISAQTKSKS